MVEPLDYSVVAALSAAIAEERPVAVRLARRPASAGMRLVELEDPATCPTPVRDLHRPRRVGAGHGRRRGALRLDLRPAPGHVRVRGHRLRLGGGDHRPLPGLPGHGVRRAGHLRDARALPRRRRLVVEPGRTTSWPRRRSTAHGDLRADPRRQVRRARAAGRARPRPPATSARWAAGAPPSGAASACAPGGSATRTWPASTRRSGCPSPPRPRRRSRWPSAQRSSPPPDRA